MTQPAGSVVAEMDSGRGGRPDLGPPTRLVLVRHGVTDFTVAGRLDGRGGADPPLNELGLAQARSAGPAVAALAGDAVAGVITSSLRRVRMTGEPIAAYLGVGASVDADWDERGFGQWDGLTMGQIHAQAPQDLDRMRQDPSFPPPGGESRDTVTERVLAAYRRSLAAGDGRTVVVVTSRMPLLIVLGHVLRIDPHRFWALSTEPASVSVIDHWSDGTVAVPALNRIHHLPTSSG